MSADFNTSINMSGSGDDLLSLLSVLKTYATTHYTDEKKGIDVRLDTIRVCCNKKEFRFEDLGEEQLNAIVESGGKITIEASGPYGRFENVNDTRLFENMADAAPNASFSGTVSGSKGSADVFWKGMLKRGVLDLEYRQNGKRYGQWDDGGHEDCDGLKFVITGKLCYFDNRDELTEYIEVYGGKVVGSVSKNVDFLICNDQCSATSKIKRAQDLKIPVITEMEFLTRFGDLDEADNSMDDDSCEKYIYNPINGEYNYAKEDDKKKSDAIKTSDVEDVEEELESIFNLKFYMHTAVIDKLIENCKEDTISIAYGLSDSFTIDEIEKPMRWELYVEDDNTAHVTVYARDEHGEYLFDNAVLQMKLFSDGSYSELSCADLVKFPADVFWRYLYVGVALRKDFAAKKMFSDYRDINPMTEGIIVDYQNGEFQYTRVSEKDRPSMACYANNSNFEKIIMARPYINEHEASW